VTLVFVYGDISGVSGESSVDGANLRSGTSVLGPSTNISTSLLVLESAAPLNVSLAARPADLDCYLLDFRSSAGVFDFNRQNIVA
jgi:hypothetical protein